MVVAEEPVAFTKVMFCKVEEEVTRKFLADRSVVEAVMELKRVA